MLSWIAIAVFGFSIATTWHSWSKKKNERNNRLKSIRKQIEANEKAKEQKKQRENTNTVEQKLKDFKK